MSHSRKHIDLRIYDFSSDYEVEGFQKKLNDEAKQYLQGQGIRSKIMPDPQGSGAGGIEVAPLAIRVISLLVKLVPAINKYTLKLNEQRVDENMRRFTIWICATNSGEHKPSNNRLSRPLVLIGYDLKQYLEEKYSNYIFTVEISISSEANKGALQIYINKLRPTKADIGRLLKLIERKTKDNHYVEYVTLKDNSQLHYTFYDK